MDSYCCRFQPHPPSSEALLSANHRRSTGLRAGRRDGVNNIDFVVAFPFSVEVAGDRRFRMVGSRLEQPVLVECVTLFGPKYSLADCSFCSKRAPALDM